MSNKRRLAIRFGGTDSSPQHDTLLKVRYFNIFNAADADQNPSIFNGWSGGKVENYNDIFGNYLTDSSTQNYFPIINSFIQNNANSLKTWEGLLPSSLVSSKKYSIFRREYQVYLKPGRKIFGYLYQGIFYEDENLTKKLTAIPGVIYIDINSEYYYQYDNLLKTYFMVDKAKIFKGEWEPVIIDTDSNALYDYNISNGKSYQYLIYLNASVPQTEEESLEDSIQVFANSDENYNVWLQDSLHTSQGKLIKGSLNKSNSLGAPVSTNWEEWSICELVPENNDLDIPLVSNTYRVDPTQVWRFKFSLETGSQKQNISRSDFQTLGQFSKIGYGNANYISGNVSALMGSEIIWGSKNKYVERMSASRISPLSTNEKNEMLNKWREFVASKNPKLLKDIKGQAWIVQIDSSESSVKNFYNSIPDTISFQWKQIEDSKNVVIYSSITSQPAEIEEEGEMAYEPLF